MAFGRPLWLLIHLVLLTSCALSAQITILNTPSSNQTVSRELFAELDELARIVDITYCVGLVGAGIQKPFECLSRCKDFENFELISTWNTGPLFADSCGFIALSHPPSPARLIVAFRGTYSITNTIADLSTIPQEYVPYPGGDEDANKPPQCRNCTVHMGFYNSWRSTRDEILPHIEEALRLHPGYSLTLVGHSLGGAVAALAGLELHSRGYNPILTTFGEPRIGNQALADYIDGCFHLTNGSMGMASAHSYFRRITHIGDPVPQLPLEEWGYAPHGGEIFIAKTDVPPDIDDLRHCNGSRDPSCSTSSSSDWQNFPWGLPTRFKLWQLFFAHRDYFWRLGLCVPDSKWFSWLPNIANDEII